MQNLVPEETLLKEINLLKNCEQSWVDSHKLAYIKYLQLL